MFKNVFIYELEKFWSKKGNIICFILIPIIVLISLQYALKVNLTTDAKEVIFSSNLNFPIMNLQEILIPIFNIIIIVFFTLSFNEEYRKGNLRMTFTRAISIKKLYIAKNLVIAINIILLIIIHFLVCYVVGEVFLPKVSETALFFKEGLYGHKDTIIYTLKFYIASYITLIAFGSIVEFFSIKCRTITVTLGLSIATLFINFLYIALILSIFNEQDLFKYMSISIVYAQFGGMAYFASGVTNAFILGMLLIILIFQLLSYLSFISEDYLE